MFRENVIVFVNTLLIDMWYFAYDLLREIKMCQNFYRGRWGGAYLKLYGVCIYKKYDVFLFLCIYNFGEHFFSNGH